VDYYPLENPQGAVRAGCDRVPAMSTEYGVPVPHIAAVALEYDGVIWESGTVGQYGVLRTTTE
jgi:hypothetical protein